ncbi:MAG: hypothetical protein FWC23_09700 [Chitinispirillia bacterium]|nr:hypothetical protein [Chitinispirillia bacterium]MCL2269443.1 hypothetical protein [Chitinispirillia bacterium]
MSRIFRGAARSALILSLVLMMGVAGCGGSKTKNGDGKKDKVSTRQRVSDEDQAKLDEARKAAEAAERRLSELRLERTQLESGGQ